jgi:hypothetical protein
MNRLIALSFLLAGACSVTTYTACGTDPDGPHIIVLVPRAVGDYKFHLSWNMTFVSGSNNSGRSTAASSSTT